MKICFVVLNFNLTKETIELVSSIKTNLDTDEYHIFIVDNASANGAGEALSKRFNKDEKVTVKINKENLGFANGNNVGIDLARELKPEFIICMNNDMVFEQQNFYKILKSAYEKTGAAAIGPEIFVRDYSSGSITGKSYTLARYKEELSVVRKRQKALRLGEPLQVESFKENLLLKHRRLKNLYLWLKGKGDEMELSQAKRRKLFKKTIEGKPKDVLSGSKKNVLLHGSFIIFTPKFFEKLTGFYTGTFLYYEEDHLYHDLIEEGLSSLYLPSLAIYHLEGRSFERNSELTESERERLIKMYAWYEESLQLLIYRISVQGKV